MYKLYDILVDLKQAAKVGLIAQEGDSRQENPHYDRETFPQGRILLVENIDSAQLTTDAEQHFIDVMGKITKAMDSLGNGWGLNQKVSSRCDASNEKNKIYVKLARAGTTQLHYARTTCLTISERRKRAWCTLRQRR